MRSVYNHIKIKIDINTNFHSYVLMRLIGLGLDANPILRRSQVVMMWERMLILLFRPRS